jgi:uroporphyrinogen decarboxylase
MERLNAHERWQAVLAGDRPDRPPMSFWRHFYEAENSPDTFAEAMVGFQRRFNWDMVKINAKASYHVEPWGVTVERGKTPLDKPKIVSWPVHQAEDLAAVKVLPSSDREFAAQLQVVAAIRKALPRPLPVLMTVFSPLSVLGDLVPDEGLLVRLMAESPRDIHAALENITVTFSALATEFLNAGADGLFLATTEWASSDVVRWEHYEQFGRPYDLRVLAEMKGNASLSVLHVCGSNNFLGKFGDYPAEVVNWDAADPTNPALREGHAMLRKPIMGGLDRYQDLMELEPAALANKTRKLVEAHADLPFAVGPGCAVPVSVPLERLEIVKNAVNDAAKRR